MDTVARKAMELYTNQKGKRKTEFNDLELQCQGLVFPQAYDALTCVWCRKQEKLFRLQSLAAVFQHFESQSHVRSQDDGEVTHTHPAPQEQQPQVEQKQEPTDEEPVNEEPTDEEPVNDPASSGLEWSSDKHLPASDELLELSKEQQEAILRGSGDLSFNMSPWIRALVSIVYDFNEGLPEYCAEQVLVLSNCVPAEFQQTLQHQTSRQARVVGAGRCRALRHAERRGSPGQTAGADVLGQKVRPVLRCASPTASSKAGLRRPVSQRSDRSHASRARCGLLRLG